MKLKKVLWLFCFFFFVIFNVKALEVHPTLKELLVDGVSVLDFEPTTYEYEVTVSKNVEKVNLGYTADNGFKAKHTGPLKLQAGKNVYQIIVSNPDDTDAVTYTLTIIKEDDRSNNNYLSSLTIAGNAVSLNRDQTDYEVYLESGLTKASITATRDALNSSFLEGYGERIGNNTVELNGERTEVEIKVQAENEEIRTYHITIIRSDYKSNDTTLQSLTIQEIPFNFKGSIYEYNLEVENEIEDINIEAIPNHPQAEVHYSKTEKLSEGINKIKLTVTAEDGTSREYVLNITRKEVGTLVQNIMIEGIVFNFNPTIYNYEIETTASSLKFKVDLTKESSVLKIKDNKNLANGSIVKLEISDDSKKVTYSFKILKKDLGKEANKLAADINVQNTPFQKYEMGIGLGVFGIGIFATLTAILTRPKKETE